MRTVLIGGSGQLGTALSRILDDRALPLSHDRADLLNPNQLRSVLEELRPDCVINCAAYNFVDKAEDEPGAAYDLNALGPRSLAEICRDMGLTLVHISSDYVFGLEATRTAPYVETDAPGPQGAYAMSKLAGEYFVRSICPRHFVVRTCGLYGVAASAGKGNFVKTMIRLAGERPELSIVNDQHCTPSSATDVARAIVDLIGTTQYGLFHVTNSGATTWHDFAVEIFRLRQLPVRVRAIPSTEFKAKAPRPPYSVLDCSKLTAVIERPMPPWQDGLASYLSELS